LGYLSIVVDGDVISLRLYSDLNHLRLTGWLWPENFIRAKLGKENRNAHKLFFVLSDRLGGD